jgi:hypothetical protein
MLPSKFAKQRLVDLMYPHLAAYVHDRDAHATEQL